MHDPSATSPTTGAASLPGRLLFDRPDGLPDAPALGIGDTLLTYADLRAGVETAAAALRAEGVAFGARVALVIPNSPEYVVAILATTALGATAVPIDPNVGPERLAFILEETTPTLCLREASIELPDHAEVPMLTVAVDRATGAVSLTRDGAEIAGAPGALPEIDAETPAIILFSAGSTGRPKGVILKHRHLVRTAEVLGPIIGMDADHRDLIICPMTHSGGWQRVSATLMNGGCVFVPEGFLAVPTILEAIQRHRIKAFFTTPPFLRTLLRTSRDKVREKASTMESIEIASAPVAGAELAQLMEHFGGLKVFLQYGLTECSRALILNAHEFPDKLHTIGRPTPGMEVMIAGPDGAPAGLDEPGEILLKAPQRTDGYYNAPHLDAERFRDGWLLTGDYGSIDADGFVTFRGRRDDVINCGGLSYFPAEAEMELGPVEGLKAYLIAGVPDPQKLLNHVPWAFVVPNDPGTWEPKTFLAAARAKLPPHMVPRFVKVIDAIVMTGPSKPNRRLTVEKYGPGSEETETTP